MKSVVLPIVLSLCLAACDTQQEELSAWMKQTRDEVRPPKANVDPPKKFEPFTYENKGLTEPFSVSKLQIAIEKASKSKQNNALAPDTSRRREVLESYPLEGIKMVGLISNKQVSTALLQVDTLVYQAKVGNFLGQNFGRITKISDSEVFLKEVVQDATGDWVERDTSLKIQEAKKQ